MISSARVFGKSLHWLAAGWTIAVVWLYAAQIQRGWLIDPLLPTNYHAETLLEGLLPAVVVEIMAIMSSLLTGPAPTRALERREWVHAFVWSLFPNVMVLYTVYLIVLGDL